MLSILCLFSATGLAVWAQSPLQQALQQIDAAMERVDLQRAKVLVDSLLPLYPNFYEVLWRAARVLVSYADLQSNMEEQERIAMRAKEIAERAVQQNPYRIEGYVYRAAANGKIALFKGVFGVGAVVNSIREDTEKALQIAQNAKVSPQFVALAHYILGRAHLKLAEKPKLFRMPLGLGWGNIKDALFHLRKAVELDPRFVMYRLDYAKALLEEGDKEEARKHLAAIDSLPVRTVGDKERKEQAKTLLRKL